MKTKLSFWLLPSCLGMVLTLALAACGGDSGNGPGGGSNSSSSSDSGSGGGDYSLHIDDFKADADPSGYVIISGSIYGGGAENPVSKVTFSPSNLASLIQNAPDLPSASVKLSAYIDLSTPSIPCGTPQTLKLEACIGSKCDNRETSFVKPQSLCASLSSSGAAVSSSSETAWKFGASTPESNVSYNTPVSLGSASFKLVGDADFETQPGLVITGGTVKEVGYGICGDETPEVGKAYSCSGLGSDVPTSTSIGVDDEFGVQNGSYYLIYAGSSVYLVKFVVTPPTWPKKYTYWTVTEHP